MTNVLNRTYKEEHDKKYRILYVDDEEVNLRIFERAFKRYYDVHTANSGHDAIELLKKYKMDLIMTDQRMPNMTGVELLLNIVPKYPNIVRMIMTGFSDEDEIAKVEDKVGLDRFLVKPWNKDDLKDEFDRALKMRHEDGDGKPAAPKPAVKKVTKSESLDLVESTLSLVESSENQELKAEINSLVEATKSKKRPEFIQGNINDLLNLKESLMPLQQEIKLYLGDSIIVYDHRSVNKNGYWFGEVDDNLVLVSFHVNADASYALTLTAFVGAMMTELVYKEQSHEPNKLINELSNRINKRFVSETKVENGTMDICVVTVDRDSDEIFMAGANHDLVYFDANDELKALKGKPEPITPGKNMKIESHKVDSADVGELYLIAKNIMEDSGDGSEGLAGIRPFLEEIHKYPMSMQAKLFEEYKYKSIIGFRL